jgi:soluble lytic murein transglycosylase
MSILSLPDTLQSWRNNPEVTGISRNDQLQAAAEQFEAMFLQQILKQMRKAGDVLSEDSLMRSRELDTMRDFHDEVLAEHLAGQRQTGIASMIVEQMGGEPRPSQAMQAPIGGSWSQQAAFKSADETVALEDQQMTDTGSSPHASAAFAQPIRPDTKENRS